MRQTLTAAVVDRIVADFSDGRRFTRNDFADIAASHGKELKAVTHILRHQVEYGLIKVVGERETSGSFMLRVYTICTEGESRLKEKFTCTNPVECADNLQSIIFNWGNHAC